MSVSFSAVLTSTKGRTFIRLQNEKAEDTDVFSKIAFFLNNLQWSWDQGGYRGDYIGERKKEFLALLFTIWILRKMKSFVVKLDDVMILLSWWIVIFLKSFTTDLWISVMLCCEHEDWDKLEFEKSTSVVILNIIFDVLKLVSMQTVWKDH